MLHPLHCKYSAHKKKCNFTSYRVFICWVGRELGKRTQNCHVGTLWFSPNMPKPRNLLPFYKATQGSNILIPSKLFIFLPLSSKRPQILGLLANPPKKMHTICHSKSNFPTSSWRMPWALAGPMPHGRRRCPGLDAKHRRHRCQVLRCGSEVAPTSKPCRIELRMTSC